MFAHAVEPIRSRIIRNQTPPSANHVPHMTGPYRQHTSIGTHINPSLMVMALQATEVVCRPAPVAEGPHVPPIQRSWGQELLVEIILGRRAFGAACANHNNH